MKKRGRNPIRRQATEVLPKAPPSMSLVETTHSEIRTCGECSLCCKVFDDIGGIDKPKGGWCPHCSLKGGGCKIYADRPDTCRSFQCLWIQARGEEHALPDWMKPNKVRFVVNSPNGYDLVLHVDPSMPDAWRKPEIIYFFSKLAEKMHGFGVITVIGGGRYYQILPQGPVEVDGKQETNGLYTLQVMRHAPGARA